LDLYESLRKTGTVPEGAQILQREAGSNRAEWNNLSDFARFAGFVETAFARSNARVNGGREAPA
jgi:hypothetical protein